MTFDQAQSPRLGQRTAIESTYVRMFSGTEIPEAAWPGQLIYRNESQGLQIFNGNAWEDVVGGVPGTLTFVGTTIPVAQHAGDIWFDSGNGNLMYVAHSQGADAIVAGEWELVSAEVPAITENTYIYHQDTPPGAGDTPQPKENDFWYETPGNHQYYYVSAAPGTHWVSVRDTGIEQAQEAAEGAQGTADEALGTANEALTAVGAIPPRTDGQVPATSPAVTVTPFALRSVRASWGSVSNAEPVRYQVYVSDAPMPGTTPDPTKLFDTTAALSVVIPATVRKYVRVRAVDEDGGAVSWGAEGNAMPVVFDPVDLVNLTEDVTDYIDQQEIDALAGMESSIAPTIKGYVVEYAVNSSETVAPTTGWSTAQPTRTPGQFIWTRTTVTRHDDTTSTTAPALLTGNTGATGSQGIQGSAGTAGTTYYTWLKYASSATPAAGDMSDSPAGKTYMGIGVGKTSAIESTFYTDYTWSLIQGPQGNQGIPGTPGADGVTTYTWVKYAPNGAPTNLQISDLPAGMTHIGLAFNKTTATESTVATDYTWSLIQGPQGSPGIQGNPGADGITYYTWLKYASSATPAAGDMADLPTGKTYMGIAVGKTSAVESTVYTDYNWSLIQGAQGNQGIPGTPGADGVTTYTWVKYAPNGTPSDAQISDLPAGMTHIGLAFNKTTATESTSAAQYQWSLIQGPQGSPGIPGTPGADGITYYTWLKYASSSTPLAGDMSDSPVGKTYMGIAVGKTSATETTVYADYTWSLIQGPQGNQGIQGPAGADGQPTYTWVKYGTSVAGAGINDSPVGMTYIGLAFNKTTAVESTDPLQYQWSLIQGPQGSQGIQGPAGPNGASLYTWLKYADTPTTGMNDLPAGKTYMGVAYNKTSSTESSTYTDYEWSLIQGPQGNTGIQGPAGANGQPTYTWIKYAPNGTPTDVQISDLPAGMTYIGFAFNKTVAAESTVATDYTWSLIQGPQGNAGTPASMVDLVATTQVLSATAVAGAATTPTTAVVTGTATNTTISTWTFNPDGAGFGAAPAYVSVAGNVVTVTGATMTAKSLAIRATGASGVTDTMTIAKVTASVGISGAPVITYQAGSSATTAPTGSWVTTPPATTPGQFLWTRTITTYTDNSTGTAYAVAAHGTTGTPGTTVTGNVIDYQVGSSGTSVPVSTWVTSPVPVTTPGQFLWTRTTTSYSGGVPSAVSYSVAAHGTSGAAGADAITVVLTNESMNFAGGLTAALGGTEDTGVIAYKGAVQQTIDVGTITVVGAPAGISAAILSGDLSTAPIIRVTTTTGLTATSGTIDVALIVAGQSFTKVISWAVNRTGAQGGQGNQGNSITAVTPYWAQVTTGAAAPTQPTTQATPPAPWVATEPAYASNTEMYTTEKITYSNVTYTYTTVAKSSTYSGMLPKISLIGTSGKAFRGVATYMESSTNLVGNIVIDTPITFTAQMCKFRISGYNYHNLNGTIDLEVAAYAYTTPSVVNASAVNSGNMPVTVRIGRKISTGTMRIIIKSEATSNYWQYPRIANLDAEIGSTTAPDSWLSGWTITRIDEATTLSSSDLVVAPTTANLPADLSSKVQWGASAPVNGSTIGKVGDLYYVKSGTTPNTQIDAIYECTTANNWTIRYVESAAIKNLAVGKITALGTELSKLTGGGHLIDPKPTLVANDPVVGSISWPQFKVKYQEHELTVPLGNTANKWVIYRWSGTAGSIAYSDTRPTLAVGDMILFSNVSGVPFRVFGTVLVDGDMVIDGSLSTKSLIANEIYSDEGYFGKLDANQIEAGSGLINELELIGGLKLNVTTAFPDGTMRLNPREGLFFDHPDPVTGLPTGKKTYIKADGTGSQFIGNATLDNLTVNGGMNLSGANLAISGTVRTLNGYATPTNPVSVTGSHPVNTARASSWWDGTGGARGTTSEYHAGLCDTVGGGEFVTARYGIYGGPYGDIVWGSRIDSTSFIEESLPTGWSPIGGVTRIGGTYYTLCCPRNATGVYTYTSWRIYKIAQGGTVTGSFDMTHGLGSSSRIPSIGNDGTNLLFAIPTTSDTLYIRTCLPTFTGTLDSTGQIYCGAYATTTKGIIRTFAAGPTGLDRYYVISAGGSYCHTTAGVRTNAENFSLAAGSCNGAFIDTAGGGTIKTLHSDGKVYSYTWLSGTWAVGHSWYGTARAPNAAAETFAKVITVTPPRFADWTVSLSEAPPGTDADTASPNAARIYAGPVGAPTFQDLLTSGAPWSKTYTTPWPVTTPGVPTSNGFSTRPGGLGVLESWAKQTDLVTPIWRVQGSGDGFIGSALSWDSTGTSTVPTAGFRSTTTDQTLATSGAWAALLLTGTPDHNVGGITYSAGVITVPVAGIYVVNILVNWVSSAAGGRRIVQLARWASAAGVPVLGFNGNSLGRQEISPNSYATNMLVIQASLAAGDKLRTDCYQSSGVSLAIDNSTPAHFDVRKIG